LSVFYSGSAFFNQALRPMRAARAPDTKSPLPQTPSNRTHQPPGPSLTLPISYTPYICPLSPSTCPCWLPALFSSRNRLEFAGPGGLFGPPVLFSTSAASSDSGARVLVANLGPVSLFGLLGAALLLPSQFSHDNGRCLVPKKR